MYTQEKEQFRQAVNDRLAQLRPHIQAAVIAAQAALPGGQVLVRDGHSGIRYVSTILWRSKDINYVQTENANMLYQLLVEGTVGAAQYRLAKLQAQARMT